MKLVMHFLDLSDKEITFLTTAKPNAQVGVSVANDGTLTTLTAEGTFEEMLGVISVGAHLNHFELHLTRGKEDVEEEEKKPSG